MIADRSASFGARIRQIPDSVLVGTAGASLIAVIGLILARQPLYLVVALAALPWIPLLLVKSLQKVRRYGWLAIFGVLLLIVSVRAGEHIAQFSAARALDGIITCPPPVDSEENAARAIAAGLRDPSSAATGLTASLVVAPDANGSPYIAANGSQVSGAPPCGVFGQLSMEVVSFLFILFCWLCTGILLARFPRSLVLWIAFAVLALQTLETFYISYTYLFDRDAVFAGTQQLWATIIDGQRVTAIPVGLEPVLARFYDVAGKYGLLAQNGMLAAYAPSLNPMLPTRPILSFLYSIVTFTALGIAFLLALREGYDKYLELALPGLRGRDLMRVSRKLDVERYRAGTIIVKQGGEADGFYVISKGIVEVYKEDEKGEISDLLANLRAGQYFGEVGLRKGMKRMASVRAVTDVELLKLDAHEFGDLVQDSGLSREQIDAEISRRLTMTYERYIAQALPTLSPEELHRVVDQVESEVFDAGDTIVKQGDDADMFYIIAQGEVDVIDENNGGKVIDHLRAGQYFGEIGLRRGGKRTATVRASTAVEVLKLDQCEFDDLVSQSSLSRDEIDRRIQQRVEQLVSAADKGTSSA